mmetsp:Transcript_19492/g.34283  ORF Transcript_19492/g.34283 Transcript_19492/m.34283 type:complete len:95 (+) Transcript_19492:103-387(+)
MPRMVVSPFQRVLEEVRIAESFSIVHEMLYRRIHCNVYDFMTKNTDERPSVDCRQKASQEASHRHDIPLSLSLCFCQLARLVQMRTATIIADHE